MPESKPSWIAPVALVIAVVAVALAVWGLVRPPASSDASGASPDEAKTQICAAFDMVRQAVSLQTNANLGPERVAVEAVAANARLATLGGGQYLLARLDGSPVSDDLDEAVRSFANQLEDIGMRQLAGTSADDPGQRNHMSDAQASAERIVELCK
ncbi:MAG: hypothetical protein K0U78_04770 [Actinomycetia bacterium]|nr:hypothetical protein [Actinomycetes bacterium]